MAQSLVRQEPDVAKLSQGCGLGGQSQASWSSLLVLGVDGLVVCFKQEVDAHPPSLAKWDGNQ